MKEKPAFAALRPAGMVTPLLQRLLTQHGVPVGEPDLLRFKLSLQLVEPTGNFAELAVGQEAGDSV